ncbi:unnamed protein product [Ostreobium quekettii]|uniref:Uncharacterized protein n=1 Tax=Ostreobium quekettii TaxID=121088 RepID=A0A8S1INL1_9CHLO|nr:unnamed protein product [Ostreobium quekettii]
MPTSTLRQQTVAMIHKNVAYQKRRCCLNACIALTPLLFVSLIYAIQLSIDRDAGSLENVKRGCPCLCCDRANITNCRSSAGLEGRQCPDAEVCNSKGCGAKLPSQGEIALCRIEHPVSWPPAIQNRVAHLRDRPWASNAVMLYAGQDEEVASTIASYMFSDSPSFNITGNKFMQMAKEQDVFRGEMFTNEGFVFGTDWEPGQHAQVDLAFSSHFSDLHTLSQKCSAVPGVSAVFSENDSDLSFSEIIRSSSSGDALTDSCVNILPLLTTADGISRQFSCSFEEANCNASRTFHEPLSTRKLLGGLFAEREYIGAWDFKVPIHPGCSPWQNSPLMAPSTARVPPKNPTLRLCRPISEDLMRPVSKRGAPGACPSDAAVMGFPAGIPEAPLMSPTPCRQFP